MNNEYIHGVSKNEQERLKNLNSITNQSFIDYLELSEGMKICDFGCGMGNLIYDINQKYDGLEIVGIEISEEQYEIAKKNTEKYKNIKLKQCDVLKSSLPSNYFDVTYCRYLIEHVQSPVDVIKEMLRITKPGGKVVVQENDLDNIIIYPEIYGHREVIKSFCDLQIQMGGDPYIGRKLFNIFKEANAKHIKINYSPEIYTEETPDEYGLWLSNSLSILIGAKEELIARGLINESLFNSVCLEMKRRIEKPDGVSMFHWNRVKVVKE